MLHSDKEHELVLKVDNITNSSISLDYFLIQEQISNDRSVSMMVGNPFPFGTLFDNSSQQHVEFSDGWALDKTLNNVFTNSEASVTVTFNGHYDLLLSRIFTADKYHEFFCLGTAIQLYGDTGVGGKTSTTVTYKLDDQTPESVPLLPPDEGSDFFYNQLFFNISGISPQEHRLVVSHNATTGMSLALKYFVVDVPPESMLIAVAPPLAAPGHSRARIIGGVVGRVISLLLVLLIAGFWTRRIRRKRLDRSFIGLPMIPFSGMSPTNQNESTLVLTADSKRVRLHQSHRSSGYQEGPNDHDAPAHQGSEVGTIAEAVDSGWRDNRRGEARASDGAIPLSPPRYTEG